MNHMKNIDLMSILNNYSNCILDIHLFHQFEQYNIHQQQDKFDCKCDLQIDSNIESDRIWCKHCQDIQHNKLLSKINTWLCYLKYRHKMQQQYHIDYYNYDLLINSIKLDYLNIGCKYHYCILSNQFECMQNSNSLLKLYWYKIHLKWNKFNCKHDQQKGNIQKFDHTQYKYHQHILNNQYLNKLNNNLFHYSQKHNIYYLCHKFNYKYDQQINSKN